MRVPLRISLFLLAFIASTALFGQEELDDSRLLNEYDKLHSSCATADKTEDQVRYTLDVVDKAIRRRNAGTTCVPLRIHIVNRDDGTGGISLDEVNVGISYLNSFYLPANIEYYICSVNMINSTAWFDFSQSEEAALRAAHLVDDAFNIFFVDKITTNSGFIACGYAYFPFNSDRSLTIMMDNSCTTTFPNGTLVHELGHSFDLAHTHQYTEVDSLHPLAEHVPRTGPNVNCDTDGDQICDTPADPDGSNDSNCNYVNSGTSIADSLGNVYMSDVDNIMSYYDDECGGVFTPQQYTRIGNALATRLNHSAYNLLGCAPANVTDPSGLTAVVNNSYGIDLNWTDNAANETGYLLERSEDGGMNWAAVIGGGVGPDATSFTDLTAEGNKNYQYRVKASNDDCNHYSNTASVSTGLIYCVPSHQGNSCDPNGTGLGVAIYSFELSETTSGNLLIDNPNNTCNGPLSVFSSAFSAPVDAGSSYTVNVNFQLNQSGSYFAQYFTIWADLNQDSDFDDAGEMLFQSTSAGGPNRTATFTIPASATPGTTTLRIRTGSSGGGVVSDPCGFISFSEAEDYGLVISGGVSLDADAFLEGPFSNGTMLDELRSGGFIPTTEPYTTLSEFTHVNGGGGETVAMSVLNVTGNDAVIDWVFIELRDKNDPTSVLYTRSALLQKDGDIVDVQGGNTLVNFANASNDDYYVVIRHRNHLGVMTANPITLDGNGINPVDFTDPNTSTYTLGASATKNINGDMVMYSGDANRNGFISASDKNSHWRPQNGGPFDYLTSTADFNLNGFVSASDVNLHWRPNNSVVQQLP